MWWRHHIASVPFLNATWNLVQTKAYVALITKWYVTEIFSAALPPAEAPKVWIITSFLLWVITRTLEASAGGKAAEKISVSYHFVISAMWAFVCTKFHVVPRKSTLAYLCDVIIRTLEASVKSGAAEKFLPYTISWSGQCKLSFPLGLIWYLKKVC